MERLINPATVVVAALLTATPALAQEGFDPNEGERSVAALNEALKQNWEMATKAMRDGDFAAAKRHALAATRGNPNHFGVWMLLGEAQSSLADWKGARTSFIAAVRLNPASAEARVRLGVAQARTDDRAAGRQRAWLDARGQGLQAGLRAPGHLARQRDRRDGRA